MRLESRPLPDQVASLAGRQHGVVSRWQLLELGMSEFRIQRWVERGHLHRIHRGVYAVGHRNLTQEGRWMAAVLACGPGAVLSHGPAGQLQGIVPRRQRFALHVALPGSVDRSPAGIVTHRLRGLDPADTTRRLGIPVTTVTRTVWDLATVLTPLGTRRAFEQAEKVDLLDRARLASLVAASPSRRGAGVVRELLAEGAVPLDRTRTWLEDLFVVICRDHGVPMPLVDVPLLEYTVDFLWPEARVVVEADGGDHLSRSQRDRDNERDATLARAGYLVRRYTSAAMSDEQAVAAEMLAILRERLRR